MLYHHMIDHWSELGSLAPPHSLHDQDVFSRACGSSTRVPQPTTFERRNSAPTPLALTSGPGSQLTRRQFLCQFLYGMNDSTQRLFACND